MKQAIYFAALLGVGTLSAEVKSLQTPEQEAQAISKEAAVEHHVDPAVMSKWMTQSSDVAKQYVEGLDKGQFAESWTKGDQLFQHTITQKEWAKALQDNRSKLGKMQTRALKRQVPAWDPKGLPKGVYMVVEYNTTFDHSPGAVEILTLRKGTDDRWRVLTYQVN